MKLIKGAVLRRQDYLTLSYRWGNVQPFMLTEQNIRHCQQGIAITELPRTFRNAIWLTRKLGFKYLWIDAVCMKQLNPSEWARESPRMAYIFGKSLLTIAASDAEHCDAGFFYLRSPLETTSCSFAANDGHQFDLHVPCIQESTSASHLDKRGWVFQERLLAPRTVHFLKSRIRLEDRKGFSCEVHAKGNCRSLSEYMAPKKWLYSLLDSERIRHFDGTPADARLRAWSQIVADYSETELTNSKDKLPALAGLTTGMLTRGNMGYSYGLWIKSMPQDLIWKASQPGRRVAGRAPSWSWASIEGAKIRNDYGLTYRAMTEYASVVRYPADTGPMGASEGSVDVEKRVLGIQTYTLQSTAIPPEVAGNRWSIRLQGNDTRAHLYPDFDLRCLNRELDFVCALMKSGRRGMDRLEDVATMECLVLSRRTKVTGTCEDNFERVGYAVMHGPPVVDSTVRLFQQEEEKVLLIS